MYLSGAESSKAAMWHLDVPPARVANADESRQGKSSRIVQRSKITQRVVSFPYAFLRIDI
jgi:hypothetical protein